MLLNYAHLKDRTDLEPWPPIGELEGTRVLSGAPQHFGRLDLGDYDTDHMLGIWECTEGTFEWTEVGDELQIIVKGRLRIIERDGTTHEFGPGDTFFTRKGEVMTWEVLERVRKVFFAYNVEGRPVAETPRVVTP